MNVALIFAGGTGQRMNSKTKPKQFLELHGKPIIIHTLDQFDTHPLIDGIVIVCIEPWIPYLEKLLKKFGIEKVVKIVPGGETGMDSIFNGLKAVKEQYADDTIVLVHDGVRPLIDAETINADIECAEQNGCAVTVVPAVETVVLKGEHGEFGQILDRKRCWLARAPQCYRVGELYAAHLQAQAENRKDFVDSADLMSWCGKQLFPVEGKTENIKITTPDDFYFFRAISEARENSQILGL